MGTRTTPVARLEEILGEPTFRRKLVSAKLKGKGSSIEGCVVLTLRKKYNLDDVYIDLKAAIHAVGIDNVRIGGPHFLPPDPAAYFMKNEETNQCLFKLTASMNEVTITPCLGKIGQYTTEQVLRAYIRNLRASNRN